MIINFVLSSKLVKMNTGSMPWQSMVHISGNNTLINTFWMFITKHIREKRVILYFFIQATVSEIYTEGAPERQKNAK